MFITEENVVLNVAEHQTDVVAEEYDVTNTNPAEPLDFQEEPQTMESILRKLMEQVDAEAVRNSINVTRHNFLNGAERGFKKSTFNPRAELNVHFVGEQAIDAGGPTREFLTLLTKNIKESNIFHGADKFIQRNATAEIQGLYQLYGRMLSYIVVHGGSMPRFLSRNFYDMVSLGIEEYRISLTDIEPVVGAALQKILDANTADEFDGSVTDLESMIAYIGASNLIRFDRRERLLDTIINHVKENLKPVYTQFIEGLSTLSVLDTIRKHPQQMMSVFVRGEDEVLKLDSLKNIINVQYSEEGSNNYIKEIETYAMWLDYLEDLEVKGELSQLLMFVTGLSDIPPLGFDPPLTLNFIHNCEEHAEGIPFANTCSNTLRLPIFNSYEILVQTMNTILFEIGCVFTNQ